MKGTKDITKSSLVRTLVVVGVIASLCFSVGEGLRLTPFPVSAITLDETTNNHPNATASRQTSLRQYGPLDVPAQTQKRGKRQAVDYGCPPSQDNRQPSPHQCLLSGVREPADFIPLPFVSRPAGRAPPFIS